MYKFIFQNSYSNHFPPGSLNQCILGHFLSYLVHLDIKILFTLETDYSYSQAFLLTLPEAKGGKANNISQQIPSLKSSTWVRRIGIWNIPPS